MALCLPVAPRNLTGLFSLSFATPDPIILPISFLSLTSVPLRRPLDLLRLLTLPASAVALDP